MKQNPKIAIVCDWITNPGGDDKVLWELHMLFPKAPIYTTIYNGAKMSQYKNADVRTTYLNNWPRAKTKAQFYIPFMYRALRSLDLSEFDIIISSSHTVGKSITVPQRAIHICYCHTPLRYVWAPEIDNLNTRIELGPFLKPLLRYLKKQDLINVNNVDYFIANSKTIAERIKKAYGRESTVIYPPVDTEKYKPNKKIAKEDYYLTAGRLIPYKKSDLIVKAFNKIGKKLIIAGTGPELDKLKQIASSNVVLLGYVSDEKLVKLYQEAQAFIFAAWEDFGIVPVEAMSAGTPVIAFGKGGATETVVDGKTGIFFESQTAQSIIDAVAKFDNKKFRPSDCTSQSKKFSIEKFKKEFLSTYNKIRRENDI